MGIKLVSTREMPREEWLSWRRKGIGGSDAASILGLNPYRGLGRQNGFVAGKR